MWNWDNWMIPTYFCYGLAFYSMGLALLVESGRASELRFARSMRLLAAFGILHGIHEWLDMLAVGTHRFYATTLPESVLWLQVTLLASSFIALMAFGEHLQAQESNQAPHWRMTISAVIWYAGSCMIVRLLMPMDEATWRELCDTLARYVLGIPSAVMGCYVLWQQRRGLIERGMARYANDLAVAAVALAFYGVIGQLFVHPVAIFPATLINESTFLQLFGFPIQVFRAVIASILAIAMIRTLRSLEIESQQRLERIEIEKQQTELLSRQELAALNAQLKESNAETEHLLEELQQRDSLRGEFLQRITAAQESERQRIARELHDGTGQLLTGLALGLRGLAAQVNKRPEWVVERLPQLEAMATTAMGELRLLINDLRPPQLDDMGLVVALRWMLDRFQHDGNLSVDLEIRGEQHPLEPDVETILFRIAQEGMTNILKHAHAQHAWICLDFTDGVTLSVRDDGVGYDPKAIMDADNPHKAWGLIGIQERAHLINADFKLESMVDAGTTMRVHIRSAKKEAFDAY